jgi:hypothetical protein
MHYRLTKLNGTRNSRSGYHDFGLATALVHRIQIANHESRVAREFRELLDAGAIKLNRQRLMLPPQVKLEALHQAATFLRCQ